jgi:uncharacterized protein YbjQ (UPF0145 family)
VSRQLHPGHGFDVSDLGNNWSEICAYGTAIKINKV